MNWFQKSKIIDLLRPGYHLCKDIFDLPGKKRLEKNIVLKNRYDGKRAFLVLNGESLQQIDISELENECTFGVGYIFLHEDIEKMGLTFYMNPERKGAFYPGVAHWPEACLGPIGDGGMGKFYQEIEKRLGNKTALFLHSDNYKYIQRNNFFKNRTKYFIKGKKKLHLNEKTPYELNADLTKRSIGGGGSLFFSILIMMYMGFKQIYLCGAGYTYEPVYMLHFYDNFIFPKSMGKEKAEIEAQNAIENMNKKYSANFEYHGIVEKNDYYRSICVQRGGHDSNKEKHQLLNNYAKSQGVKIYNITPDEFESPIYEKISWQDAESRVLSNN